METVDSRRGERWSVLAAFGLLVCHLLLSFALIPPWQQPDEPTFVAWAELRRNQLTGHGDGPDPGREGEILQSMAEHQWWQHRDGEWPATIPKDFNITGSGTPASAPGRPPVYPWVAGRLLRLFPDGTVVRDMYVLRGLSAVAGVLSLWVAWRAARETVGPLGGAVVAIMLALHPRFAIVSTSASSDAMANLLGAYAWWQVALALKRPRVLLHLVAMWCAIVVASITDRMAVPLVVWD